MKNNKSEAVVMGLLETRPNEAKRLDEVRGRWVPTPLILAASCFPSHRLLYSLCQRHMFVRTLTTCILLLHLPCAAW